VASHPIHQESSRRAMWDIVRARWRRWAGGWTPSRRAGAAGFGWRRPGPSTWNHHAFGPRPCLPCPALPARLTRVLL